MFTGAGSRFNGRAKRVDTTMLQTFDDTSGRTWRIGDVLVGFNSNGALLYGPAIELYKTETHHFSGIEERFRVIIDNVMNKKKTPATNPKFLLNAEENWNTPVVDGQESNRLDMMGRNVRIGQRLMVRDELNGLTRTVRVTSLGPRGGVLARQEFGKKRDMIFEQYVSGSFLIMDVETAGLLNSHAVMHKLDTTK